VGLPVSLLLIALGAILAFAVHQTGNQSVDVNVVGWVLLAVGFAGLLLSMLLWERWGPGYWGWHRGAYGAGPPAGGYARRGWGYRGRRTVVEEEGGPPPGPPGPPPVDPYDAPPPP
jgi:Domain of unknown function (DUF6458)